MSKAALRWRISFSRTSAQQRQRARLKTPRSSSCQMTRTSCLCCCAWATPCTAESGAHRSTALCSALKTPCCGLRRYDTVQHACPAGSLVSRSRVDHDMHTTTELANNRQLMCVRCHAWNAWNNAGAPQIGGGAVHDARRWVPFQRLLSWWNRHGSSLGGAWYWGEGEKKSCSKIFSCTPSYAKFLYCNTLCTLLSHAFARTVACTRWQGPAPCDGGPRSAEQPGRHLGSRQDACSTSSTSTSTSTSSSSTTTSSSSTSSSSSSNSSHTDERSEESTGSEPGFHVRKPSYVLHGLPAALLVPRGVPSRSKVSPGQKATSASGRSWVMRVHPRSVSRCTRTSCATVSLCQPSESIARTSLLEASPLIGSTPWWRCAQRVKQQQKRKVSWASWTATNCALPDLHSRFLKCACVAYWSVRDFCKCTPSHAMQSTGNIDFQFTLPLHLSTVADTQWTYPTWMGLRNRLIHKAADSGVPSR